MRALAMALFVFLSTGCFDFAKDLSFCRQSGYCGGSESGGDGGVLPPPTQCTATGLCWETSMPHHQVADVFALSADDVWAVGEKGYVAHLENGRWSVTFLSSDLQRVLAFAPNDVWVAGSGGVQRFDGKTWKPETDGPLNALWGASASELWAVGDSGSIQHRTSTGWSYVGVPTVAASVKLTGVSGVGTDIYVSGENGILLHSTAGGPFLAELSGTTDNLNDVFALSATEAFAVGANGRVLHRTGGTWTQEAMKNGVWFTRVAGDTTGQVWLFGLNTTPQRRSDSGQWTVVDFDFEAVAGFVGQGLVLAAGQGGFVSRYESGAWNTLTPDNGTPLSLNAIGGRSVTDVWAVGQMGISAHFDGSRWTYARITNEHLFAVSFTSDVGFAAGSGELLRLQDGVWTSIGKSSGWAFGAFATSASDAWFVGAAGEIQHYDGGGLNAVSSGTSLDLAAVHGTGPDDIWAVGRKGTILHWTGAASGWTTVPSNTSEDLSSVYAQAPNDVWAGSLDKLHHFDGTKWSLAFDGHSGFALRGMTPDREGGLWLTRDFGDVRHHVSASSSAVLSSNTLRTMNGAYSPQPGVAFFCGEDGVLMRWQKP